MVAEDGARDTAHRTWDLALLKPLLAEMPDDPDSVVDALYTFTDFWAEREYPSYSPHTVQGRGNDITPADYYTVDSYRRILQAHREWIVQQEAALRQKRMG